MGKTSFKMPSGNLTQRIASAALALPVVALAVWEGGWLYNIFIMAMATVGLFEWLSLTFLGGSKRIKRVAFVSLIAVLGVAWAFDAVWALWLCVLTTLALFYFAQEEKTSSPSSLRDSLWAAGGLPYLAGGGIALMVLRDKPYDIGLFAVVFLLAVVWGMDIGGYAVGCSVKGPKLCPKISPKKTWSGLLGGMALAGLSGYLVAQAFDDPRAVRTALVGVGLAVFSQAGDLFESYVKRRAGAKDSGTLIPGHGGLLDRIDGLLAAAIAMAVLMAIGSRGW